MYHPLAAPAQHLHLLAPALLAHHKHALNVGGLWAMAQGHDGAPLRWTVLVAFSLIAGVIITALTSRRN